LHCHTLASDHRLYPHDKLHCDFLPRSQEPRVFGARLQFRFLGLVTSFEWEILC
jgi:hypothetical protein